MRCLALLLASVCSLFVPVRAQGLNVQLVPSPAVACMTPPASQRGEPEYPFAPWKRSEGGRVLVELIFTGTDLEPEVKVLEHEGDKAMVQAVVKHVAAFRVPCLEYADIPLRLRQDYRFEPDKRKVTRTAPVDTADPDRIEQLKCMAANDGSKTPDYPTWASSEGLTGNLLMQLKFTAPDQPPELTSHAGSSSMQRLARDTEPWARKLRLPCMMRPVQAVVVFKYRLEGDSPLGFPNIGFMQFLRSVKDLKQQRAAFDTHDMGCPFDVKLTYRQPFLPSTVGQLDAPDARRQPLLEWLSTLVLELGPRQIDAVLGDDATFTIPCVKIDLKPKE